MAWQLVGLLAVLVGGVYAWLELGAWVAGRIVRRHRPRLVG